MKKIINRVKSRFTKNLLTLFGISAVAFIFEACYGVPQDQLFPHIPVQGTVTDINSNAGIEGINIDLHINDEFISTETTDSIGEFHFKNLRIGAENDLKFEFKDIDGTDNGSYQDLDTTITLTNNDVMSGSKEINIQLKEK